MDQTLIPHLFRREFGKITAVLCKHFSMDQIELAEDIASESFVRALETWPYQGVPANPVAWLYAVARNKAINVLKRNRFETSAIDDSTANQTEIDLSEENIFDSQLRMLFALAHPSIPRDAQVALALRILCGFGIDEIASAFLTNKETINKRLYRAKEKLREQRIDLTAVSDQQISSRLESVLLCLYLLFNEGYYSETQDKIIQEDLCAEAIRLCLLLTKHPSTDHPSVHALVALMYFHTSRLPARTDENGDLILYHDQDESKWVLEFITKGAYHLQTSARGKTLSRYHLEASIAYWHTIKTDSHEKWENILQLYNHLLQLEYSPIAALNRTYALYKANGADIAIEQALKLNLHDNPFYFALLGELYKQRDHRLALQHFEQALALAKTNGDRKLLVKQIDLLKNE